MSNIKKQKKGSVRKNVTVLFNKDELQYFEKLREDTYENDETYKSLSPQSLFLPFHTVPNIYWPFSSSLPIGFFPCSSRFHSVPGEVLKWITTNEEGYATASDASTNRYIKRFTSEGNFEHIIHAVEHLGARALWCPVIIRIIGCLQSINKYALYTGDRKLREEVERIAQNIGAALLHWTSKHIKQEKVALLFRKLQYPKNKQKKWLSSEENKLMYVKVIYERYKKQSRGNRKEIKELKKERKDARKEVEKRAKSIKQVNKELQIQLTKVKGMMGESPEKKYYPEQKLVELQDDKAELESEIQNWESEIQRLEFDISSLKEEQEQKGYKEARKRTLEYLEKKTGVKISNTSFEKILAIANQINSA